MVHCTFGKRHTELSFEVQETSRSSLKPRDQGSFEHELAMRKKKKKLVSLSYSQTSWEH